MRGKFNVSLKYKIISTHTLKEKEKYKWIRHVIDSAISFKMKHDYSETISYAVDKMLRYG